MTKQEFLAMSLPYGLHILNGKESDVVVGMVGDSVLSIFRGNFDNTWDITDVRPLLRPLSDLTKPIEHKGEKFVPSYKLGVDRGFEFYKPSNFDLEINFETPNYSTQIDLFTGFLIVQKLIEWHFDIADLISKGEAIDVNTLDINPYK